MNNKNFGKFFSIKEKKYFIEKFISSLRVWPPIPSGHSRPESVWVEAEVFREPTLSALLVLRPCLWSLASFAEPFIEQFKNLILEKIISINTWIVRIPSALRAELTVKGSTSGGRRYLRENWREMYPKSSALSSCYEN